MKPEVKDKIRHISNLPTLPQVASRLMRIINYPYTSSSDIAMLVGQDLSLTAKILRLANSAFYGIPRSITNINNAVVILGFKVISTMVLSLTVFDLFPENQKTARLFDRQAFWRHSLACGMIAKLLTSKIKKFILFDPEEAFCAGLLHDIGKVVMEQYMHDEFHMTLKVAKKEKIPLFEAESKILGYSHTEVAEWLTSEWTLPDDIKMSIIHHHNPAGASMCRDIISLIHLSDTIAYDLGMSISSDYKKPQLHDGCMELLKIDASDIEVVKQALPEELEKLSVFYDVALNDKE